MTVLRRTLHESLAIAALIGRNWRLWLASALLGGLLSAFFVLLAPRLWVSEGQMILRPKFILEGYMLSTNELGPYYAVRLAEQGRVAQVLEKLYIEEEPETVEAWDESGPIIHLRVEHRNPLKAEAITRALMADFREELEIENRNREEADRLVIALSPSSFAHSANTPLPIMARLGFAAGLLVGLVLVLWRGWRQRARILAPLEAEQLIGAPTLGAIPKQKIWALQEFPY
ncbi:MAG: hypothetical protein ACPGWR_26400 [Ardenticatenaceae bacterium]